MSALFIRAVSARLQYRRGGLLFDAAPAQALAIAVVPLADLDAAQLAELIDDPNIDVLIGAEIAEYGFVGTPLRDADHLAHVRIEFEALTAANSEFIGFAQDATAAGLGDASGGGTVAGIGETTTAPLATFAPAPAAPILTDDVLGQRLGLEGSRPDDDTDAPTKLLVEQAKLTEAGTAAEPKPKRKTATHHPV